MNFRHLPLPVRTILVRLIRVLRKHSSEAKRNLWILATYPFVMAAFKWRSWRLINKHFPILFLNPGRLLQLDLELYEEVEGHKLSKDLLDDLSKTRDSLFERARKQTLVSSLIFIFLVANYFSINVDFSISGFSLKFAPGVKEGLLLIVNIIAFNTLMLQSNIHALNSAMGHIITRIFPEELRGLYTIKYFGQEYYKTYQPFNLPNLTMTNLTSQIALYWSFIFAATAFTTAGIIYALNIAIVFDLWKNPSIPFWSKAIAVYILILGVNGVFYSVITRFLVPYRDYSVNHELEITRQVHPDRHAQRLEEVYGELVNVEMAMVERGYMKRKVHASNEPQPSQPR